ncbi:MAG: hypothetical protein ACXW27_17875 [Allosphingosinicella sp.]
MMIAALLLATAANADAYDAVVEAQLAALDCERNYVVRALPQRSLEELWADARRICSSSWDEFRKARLTYHSKHRRSMRRVVPGFRPELEICWQAFQTELYRWTGMPENTALRDCKNAKN